MSTLNTEILAERASVVISSLQHIHKGLSSEKAFIPGTQATDALLFHFWLATKVVLATARACCNNLSLKKPLNYTESFRLLAEGGFLEPRLARRLMDIAGLFNLIPHASKNKQYFYLTMKKCPSDFIAFFVAAHHWLLKHSSSRYHL